MVNFFFRIFFSIRPTDPISGNAFDAKRKKIGGWPYKPTFKYNLPPGSVAKTPARLRLQNNCKFHKFCFTLPIIVIQVIFYRDTARAIIASEFLTENLK